jgi:hypothetical protein
MGLCFFSQEVYEILRKMTQHALKYPIPAKLVDHINIVSLLQRADLCTHFFLEVGALVQKIRNKQYDFQDFAL